MSSPLDPYLDRHPKPDDFAPVSTAELARIIEAAKEVEALTGDDVADAIDWARHLRTTAERALENRKCSKK